MKEPKNDDLKSVFARNLTRLRHYRKISQSEIAKTLGRDTRTIRRWEKETDPTWPPSSILPNLATILGCSIDDLFTFHSEQLPQTSTEREILSITRAAQQNIPMGFVIHQLTNLVLLMDKEERILWQDIGDRLVKHKNKNK